MRIDLATSGGWMGVDGSGRWDRWRQGQTSKLQFTKTMLCS